MDGGNLKKPHWILIRGLVREAGHWGDFADKLAAEFPGSIVTAIDLPGFGRFYKEPSPWTLSGCVSHVRTEAARVHLRYSSTHQLCTIAISLGAMVAALWAGEAPQEVKRAVLINTSLRTLSPFYQRISPFAYLALVRIMLTRRLWDKEERILDLTTKGVQSRGLLASRVELASEHPWRSRNAAAQICAAAFHRTISKPAVPILLLNSLGDQLVHPDCSTAIAESWGVPIMRHPWAGHDLPIDDPDWVLRCIADWYPGTVE